MRLFLLVSLIAIAGCGRNKYDDIADNSSPSASTGRDAPKQTDTKSEPQPKLLPTPATPPPEAAVSKPPAPAKSPTTPRIVPKSESNEEKAARLRREIEGLNAQTKAKEAELAKLDPPPETVEVDYLDPFDMKPGQAGRFGAGMRASGPVRLPPALQQGSAGAASAIARARAGNQSQPVAVRILQIINTTQALVMVETAGDNATVLLVNFPTKGLADGKYLDDQKYKVLGTVKMAGQTYYRVEPYTPKPK